MLHRALVARHQQTWNIREYHLLVPEDEEDGKAGLTSTTNSVHGRPDPYRPLNTGNPLRASLPMGVDIRAQGGEQERLEVRDPGRREVLIYMRCPSLPSVEVDGIYAREESHENVSASAVDPLASGV